MKSFSYHFKFSEENDPLYGAYLEHGDQDEWGFPEYWTVRKGIENVSSSMIDDFEDFIPALGTIMRDLEER